MLLFILAVMFVLGLPLALATSARLACTSSSEFRARVLETIASAVHRGVAVEPQFLWLIAHDVRGRRRRAVRRAATALDEGRTLSDALSTALRLPAEAVAVIAAAEGTPDLHSALQQAATADRSRMDFRHQLILRVTYPAIVLSFLGGFLGLGIAPKFQEVCDSMEIDCTAFMQTFDVARFIGLGLVVAAVVVAISGLPIARVAFARLAGLRRTAPATATTAWLHALAGALRAGRPLHAALDRTAHVIGHERHVTEIRRVAADVADGDSLDTVWSMLPVSRWLRARAPLLAGTPTLLAAAVEDLARTATDRAQLVRERVLGLLSPLLLTVAGATLGAIFLTFFVMLERVRGMAGPW